MVKRDKTGGGPWWLPIVLDVRFGRSGRNLRGRRWFPNSRKYAHPAQVEGRSQRLLSFSVNQFRDINEVNFQFICIGTSDSRGVGLRGVQDSNRRPRVAACQGWE